MIMPAADQRPRALIVDDDELFLQQCRQFLEEEGFSCSVAQGAQAALGELANGEFELLVCDVVMPPPGGLVVIDFASRLSAPPAILPVTALSRSDSVLDALKVGGWSVVFKPLDAPEFSRTVAWCLQAHRAGRLRPAQLEGLYRISAVANAESSLDRILEQVLELLIGILNADTGSIMLAPPPPAPRRLALAASYGLEQHVTGGVVDFGQHVAGWVAERKRPLRLVGPLDAYPQFRALTSNPSIAESLVAPLVFRGDCVGVISIGAREAARFGPDSLALVIAAADALGAVVYRDRADRAREHQDRLALLGRLAASIAHELRNPLAHLSATLGYVWKEVVEPAEPAPDLREAFAEMTDSIERMTSLVGSLRSTSRAPARVDELVNPGELMQRARALVLPQLKHRVALLLEAGDVQPVVAEGGRILQVLINLIVNAGQAIEQHPRADARITLRTRQDKASVYFEVEDNGPGIPEEVAQHIFQPFFTTKSETEGTGLGLSISRQIARDHGGELAFTSRPGVGTRFTLSLPRSAGKSKQPVVLVVDDEEALLRALQRVLGPTFELLTATASEHALRAVQDRQVDLVIADFHLPGRDGLWFVQRLRELGRTTPVVLLTATPEDPRVRAARDGGLVQAVMPKPWNSTYLVGQALEHIRMAKAASSD